MLKRAIAVAAISLAASCLLAQMSSEFGMTINSPYRSQVKSDRLLNDLSVELVLGQGYTESSGTEAKWRTSEVLGLTRARRFFKRLPDGTVRTIELALSRGASGEQKIYLFGAMATPAGDQPNPDFSIVRAALENLVRQQPPEPLQAGGQASPENAARYMYQLSFVQADRALAMLKALGYSTIEFSKAPGESNTENSYEPQRKGNMTLPTIMKMIDSSKTSLMDPNPALSIPGAIPLPQIPQYGVQPRQAVPDIGGTYLHQVTTGEPQQRLLILYDQNDPDSLERILAALNDEIDVPARQVVISALIVEVNTDKLRDLGVTFSASNGRVTTAFQLDQQGNEKPFTATYDSTQPIGPFNIQATIRALVDSGEAEILSNPSVLVLDGRQARIQVGQQVPVVNSTATAAGITSSVEYFPVGIVLNLRPRVSDDGTEVTMQVETIVSAVGQNQAGVGTGVFFAPTVDNRQVQTFVRVADSTPFIIGGLISTDTRNRKTGLPFLSAIPFLGGFFRTTTKTNLKREVIVVLTPHVVPLEEKNFSYVIPKDSDVFDSFGNRLFRNAYRIRGRDVYDLRFVYESDILTGIVNRAKAEAEVEPALMRAEPFAGLIRGEVPGEDILVRRMLWEIVRRTGFASKLENDRIIFFEPSPENRASTDFVLSFFKQKLQQLTGGKNALIISFDAVNRGTPEHPFAQPKGDVSYERITRENYEKRLIELNARGPDGKPRKWAIIISNEYSGSVPPLEVLKCVLVLKRVLALNTSLPLTIKEFRVGRQIIFPTEEDIQQGFHVIDRDAARLFYEVMQYYRAFEQEFNQQLQEVQKRLAMGTQ